MMQEWIKKHQQKLSMGIGAVLLIAGVAMLFWDNTGDAVSAEERAAAERVARYEARMAAETAGQTQPDKPLFSSKFQERQEEQVRYAVILLIIGGAGFMGYSFYRRFAEKKEQ